VRLTAAGLGCPDWPGCYGHLHPAAAVAETEAINAAHPTRHFDYGKALREMVHRYAATTLGVIILGLAALAVWNRRLRAQPRVVPFVLVLIVCLQGLLGALTVTKLVAPPIVTLHLAGGLTTLSILWWLSLRPEARPARAVERRIRPWAVAAIAVLAMQILLGGWTSTNYAATACPDFPTCQGTLHPATDFRSGFVLWRGIGQDYEGGVLGPEARVAIHWTHRLGAVIAGLTLLALALVALRRGQSRPLKVAAAAVIGALCLQWLIGINLIWQGFPLWLGTAHNAGAALLLLSAVTLLRYLSPVSSSPQVARR
jgi:cytochrome c oxidase assembly protein subunit 15